MHKALLEFLLETFKEFLPSISHSQSRTAPGCTGRFSLSLASPPRPAHRTALLHTRLRRRSTAWKVSAGCPAPSTALLPTHPVLSPTAPVVIDDSSISAPIPHNLKYRFRSLSQFHVCCDCQTQRRQLTDVHKCARHSKSS